MSDENVEEKCRCGRPASITYWGPQCMTCYLVSHHAGSPPRDSPGNISDFEIEQWMRGKLKMAIEEMVSLMRADLDALAEKWNPPIDEASQDANPP